MHTHTRARAEVFRGVCSAEGYSAARRSEMQPCELHGVLWSAQEGDRSLSYWGETCLESQTATGDGRKGRGGEEGVKKTHSYLWYERKSHISVKKGGGEMWGTFWSFLFVCIVFLYGFKPLSKSATADLGIWQFFYNTCFIFYLALL